MILNLIHFEAVFPILALFVNAMIGKKRSHLAARLASYFMGSGFVAGLILLTGVHFSRTAVNFAENLNTVPLLLCTLIFFISFIVHRYSVHYMDGDRFYRRYFFNLSAITLSTTWMVLTDNLFIFAFLWTLSNFLLVVLMIHKKEWAPAKSAGVLALKTLVPGSVILLSAINFITQVTHLTSINSLLNLSHQLSPQIHLFFSTLLVISAVMQSALWPFHRWLISSLNSPTPVSALMHAGLISGGGILIIRFAPLFDEKILTCLFLLGALSALLGTFWKLIQHDIKRMLACSTLAQMGFMMMQCGLGLYASAIAHLCWHGLFKAYLFLNAGSAIHQKSLKETTGTPLKSFLTALIGGFIAMALFAITINKPIFFLAPTTFLLMFAFIAGAQFSLTLLNSNPTFKRITMTYVLSSIAGVFYGLSIFLIESLVPQLVISSISKLTLIHLIPMVVFFTLWIVTNLGVFVRIKRTQFWSRFYVAMMNASQPHPKTVTTLRNLYYY